MSYYDFLGSQIIRACFILTLMFVLPACQAYPISTPDQSFRQTATSLPLTTVPVKSIVEPTLLATNTINPTRPPSVATPIALNTPQNLVNPKVLVLADNLSNPDELVLAPDGSIYVSEIGDGSIQQVTTDGKKKTILKGLNEPEGIVFLQDSKLIIAEQGKNRLMRYDLLTQSFSVLTTLENHTTQAGVDGIALDEYPPATTSIIIPDSPNGVILRLSLDGMTLSEIARGFSRPTAAWVENDGSILVVDENAHSLSRIHPDGRIQLLSRNLPTPDDVIEDNAGHIYINTLTDGAIHILSDDGRQDSILVNHLASPQGMIFDLNGDLVVTDSGNGRLLRILIH